MTEKVYIYAKDNWVKISLNTLKTIAAVGKSVVPKADYAKDVIEFFEKEYKEFNKYTKTEVTEKFDESYQVDEFLKEIEKEKVNIYGENIIQTIIEKKIQALKGKDSSTKKTVLIIDDLDRIDPEHIFRILNVFAAHFDYSNDAALNKFGFDKIILVCDIDNIRNIFHHKYGAEVNFSGYIDKFYSEEVFIFDNEKIIRDSVYLLCKPWEIESLKPFGRKLNLTSQNLFFHCLLKEFIKQGSINLRSLQKLTQSDFDIKPANFNGDSIQFNFYLILWQLKLLSKIFGEKENFLRATSKLKSISLYEIPSYESDYKELILFATIVEHNLKLETNSLEVRILNRRFNLKTNRFVGGIDLVYVSDIMLINERTNPTIEKISVGIYDETFVQVFKEAVKALYDKKILI